MRGFGKYAEWRSIQGNKRLWRNFSVPGAWLEVSGSENCVWSFSWKWLPVPQEKQQPGRQVMGGGGHWCCSVDSDTQLCRHAVRWQFPSPRGR